MRLYKALWNRFCRRLAKMTFTGEMILQCEQGEPFVANLRIQWLMLMRSLGSNSPPVVQLLGDIDDVVTREDNQDVIASKGFIWATLNGTRHADAINFHEKNLGEARQKKFEAALGTTNDLETLRRESPRVPDNTDTNVVELVIVMHGIRDLGEWTSQFEPAMQACFQTTHTNGEKLLVYHPSYGFFTMGAFLLWNERQANVRWFMDELTEVLAKYPNLSLTNIHFVGHSNGTYILASALEKYKVLQVGRIVFAGSVVRRDYDWNLVRNRMSALRNYRGTSDLVVAFFPRLFQFQPFRLLKGDIGSLGYDGLASTFKQCSQITVNYGGHSTALDSSNSKAIADFIILGAAPPVWTIKGAQAWYQPLWDTIIYVLSRICPVVWFIILLALSLLGVLVARVVIFFFGRSGGIGASPTPLERFERGVLRVAWWLVFRNPLSLLLGWLCGKLGLNWSRPAHAPPRPSPHPGRLTWLLNRYRVASPMLLRRWVWLLWVVFVLFLLDNV
jgi:pimeloyl-ACP methyl ester carboxylesterase